MKSGKKPLYSLAIGFLLFSVFLPQSASAELTFSFKFGSSGTDNDEFKDPSGIVITSNGRTLYVADKGNDRIIVLEDDGDYDFGSFCNMASSQGCNDDDNPTADENGDGQFKNRLLWQWTLLEISM